MPLPEESHHLIFSRHSQAPHRIHQANHLLNLCIRGFGLTTKPRAWGEHLCWRSKKRVESAFYESVIVINLIDSHSKP